MTLSVQYICLVTEDEHETFDCLCAEDRVTQQRKQLGGEERRRGEGRGGRGEGEGKCIGCTNWLTTLHTHLDSCISSVGMGPHHKSFCNLWIQHRNVAHIPCKLNQHFLITAPTTYPYPHTHTHTHTPIHTPTHHTPTHPHTHTHTHTTHPPPTHIHTARALLF